MGKGDKRTKRGKVWAGTFGKSRPKSSNLPDKPEPAAEKKAPKPAKKATKAKKK